MIRNVHNALMALSLAGLVLVVALMLATPAAGMATSEAPGAPAPLALAGTPGPVLVAAAQRLEPASGVAPSRRAARRPDIRSAIALPYFSFAQGLRRGKGV